MNNRM